MVEVKITENGMTAQVMICPETDEELTVNLVEDTLRLEGVQAGIDKEAIADLLEKKIYHQFMPVAGGKEPVNGSDGYYEFFFSTDENNGKPKIREDGSVDYNYQIINVNEGDLLAKYHPETGGSFGYNVFSKMLSPVRGKAKRALRCQNVRMEENEYYAAQNGSVTLCGNTLSIHNVLEVMGDTAYDQGDIDFNGDVHVAGNICNGITVRASGSVIVDGVIENARVYAGLDVVVSRGIHGQGTGKDGQYPQEDQGQTEAATIVEAKGQLKSKFIDHAFARAEGDIFMDYAVGSVIVSEGKVTAYGVKGAIIGGSVTALLGVDAGALGNSALLPTEIKVGEEKGFMQKFSAAKEQLHGMEEKLPEYRETLPPEKVQEMVEQAKKQMEILEQKFRDRQIAPIIVRKALYPNVCLRFGKTAVPESSGRWNVEFRRIGENILCKTIGTFAESELTCGAADKKTQAVVRECPGILIIDDDTRLLRTVHGILEKDYRVAVAANGRVGRKYLEKNSVDLILLDYMMPEENGVEVLKSLRANEDTKDIPVVFLTGLDDKKKIVECLSLNPAGYILKPVDREKLLMKIRAILGEKCEEGT